LENGPECSVSVLTVQRSERAANIGQVWCWCCVGGRWGVHWPWRRWG